MHINDIRYLSLAALLCALLLCASARAADSDRFGVLYTVWMKPQEQAAVVKIRLTRNIDYVDWLELRIDPERFGRFQGTGEVSEQGDKVRWVPPAEDAWLQYRVKLSSKRDNGRYDGLITSDWALFRADDLVPPFHSSFRDLTRAEAKLQFNLPPDWSVQTRYARYASGRFELDDAHRKFDRPTGWLVMGKIGSRLDRIGDVRVTVAAPEGQNVRYLDILAFFRWTMPQVQAIFPDLPGRLLVVSAGDPMWRGALSGPASLFVHSDRPMISGNGTSTFIHELIHVAMRARGGPGADWIVEGLAEYYSLEVLRRSGAISEKRFEAAHRELAGWGAQVQTLEVARASGPVTAKAVGVLRDIDRNIRSGSGGAHSLDDVARELAAEGKPVTVQRFNELVAQFSAAEGDEAGKVR